MIKKRIISLLLAMLLALSAAPAALAEEAGVRETDFFTKQPHSSLQYEEMSYEHLELEPFLEETNAIRALLKEPSNEEAVRRRYGALSDRMDLAVTMLTLAMIRSYQDTGDQALAEEVTYATLLCTDMQDAYLLLLQDVLASPCGGFLREQFSDEEIAAFLEYESLSDAERDLVSREAELTSQYLSAYARISVDCQGRTWRQEDISAALLSGELNAEAYASLRTALAQARNQALGEIYLELAELRRELAQLAGYEDYAAYCYEAVHWRDYAPEDLHDFYGAVKSYIVPLYEDLYTLYRSEPAYGTAYTDYSGSAALDLIEPYLGQLSSEMAEAFTYMREQGLYDTDRSRTKGNMVFTTILPSYGAPFYFGNPGSTPGSGIYDFCTTVHEFGHYNHFYWHPCGWLTSDGPDTSEVHSQGLELLFSHFYPEIFGEGSDEVILYELVFLLSNIADGCLHDELEQFVYENGDVTLEQINRKYRQLCGEYGMADPDDPREELYGWVDVNHLFTQPFYYISYAVSAAGAFSFWLDAQDDYFAAVDEYLTFAALDTDVGFQAGFEMLGMDTPLSPAYLEHLAGTMRDVLEVDARLAAIPPVDIIGIEWFAEAAYALYAAGVLEKDGDGCLHPFDTATWDDTAGLLEGMDRTAPTSENGGAAITRLELARLLAETFGVEEAGGTPFPDTGDGLVAALAELEVVSGYADGTFRPQQPITRGEMWTMAYRLLLAVAEPLVEDWAA